MSADSNDRDADYVGKTIGELGDEILERCSLIHPSKARPYEVRRMGWQLMMLSLLEPRRPSDHTLEALAALLGVGARPHFPIVAPRMIHNGDQWAMAAVVDGMHLNMYREGRLTGREQQDWSVALADGFGISDEKLAEYVGSRPDTIFDWRKGKHADQYRNAVEFMASSMVPGPGHPSRR